MFKIIPHSKPTLDKEDFQSVLNVLKSGEIAQGKKVLEFEKRLARYLNVKGAVAVSSGTSALHLSLLALGIKEKDEVILPSYVCLAVLNAVNYILAKPRLVDINEEDFNISFKETKKSLTKETKAIIVPHMFGLPVDLAPFKRLGIPIIEDCAQAIGATYQGKKVGSFGDLNVVSFYATKLLTTGEGGMVFSNNLKLLDKVRDLRDYDKKNSYRLRFNYKMSDIQAALGLGQLAKLDRFIIMRKKIAEIYNSAFKDCNFKLPQPTRDRDHIYFHYCIRIEKDVNKILRLLRRKGVICERPVYLPLHRYLHLEGYPVAEKVWKLTISLPIYPSLRPEEIRKIVETLKSVC